MRLCWLEKGRPWHQAVLQWLFEKTNATVEVRDLNLCYYSFYCSSMFWHALVGTIIVFILCFGKQAWRMILKEVKRRKTVILLIFILLSNSKMQYLGNLIMQIEVNCKIISQLVQISPPKFRFFLNNNSLLEI